MRDVECPYCGADVEINHDDGYGYEEDLLHEQQCEDCGKMFAYFTVIHFSYTARKADCLNGAEHHYKRTTTYPPEFARLRCKDCGHETPLTADGAAGEHPLPMHD